MSRAKAIILIILVALLTNCLQGTAWFLTKKRAVAQLNTEIDTLSATLDALGPMVTVKTVSAEVKEGTEIKESDLADMSFPSSLVGPNYMSNNADLIGKIFKIKITPLTPITTDLIMEEPIEDTTRDIDIAVDSWTVGLAVGDYIDVRLTLPYGDDWVVLSHKRIYAVNSTTLKIHLNELELHRYRGSQVDYFLNLDNGATLYADKYVEPGVQKAAEVYYSVPENIEAMMLVDPNIVDKAEANANRNMRKSIDNILGIFKDDTNTAEEEGGKLNSGRTKYNSSINSDATIVQSSAGTNVSSEPTAEDVLSDVFVEDEVIPDDKEVTTE